MLVHMLAFFALFADRNDLDEIKKLRKEEERHHHPHERKKN